MEFGQTKLHSIKTNSFADKMQSSINKNDSCDVDAQTVLKDINSRIQKSSEEIDLLQLKTSTSSMEESSMKNASDRIKRASEEMTLSQSISQNENIKDETFIDGVKEVSLDTLKNLYNMAETTGCTMLTTAISVVEGIAGVGESLIDTLAFIGTIGAYPFTFVYDKLYELVTGKESEYTNYMWDTNLGFVSKEHVSGVLDKFYDDTILGQQLYENTFGFKIVRGGGKLVGKIATILFTAGMSGIASALSEGASIGEAIITGLSSMTAALQHGSIITSITAGLLGIGEGAGKAWNTGADKIETIGYSMVNGVREFSSYELGALSSSLKSPVARVAIDAAEGAFSPIIDAATQKIYKNKSFSELFEENGGIMAVLTNTVISSGFSIFGEAIESRKIANTFFEDSSSKVGNKLSNSQIKLNKAKYSKDFDGISFKSNTEEGLNDLLRYFTDLKENFKNDISVTNRLNDLSKSGLVVTDIFSVNPSASFQNENFINLGKSVLNNKNYGTFFHETAHFSDWLTNYQIGSSEIKNTITNDCKLDDIDFNRLVQDGASIRNHVEGYLKDPLSGALKIQKTTLDKMNNIVDIDKYNQSELSEIYNTIYKDVYSELRDFYIKKTGISSIEDIADALTNGNFSQKYSRTGHGINYFSKSDVHKTTEILADFSSLTYSGKKDLLLRYFPQSFVDSLDNAHNSVFDAANQVINYRKNSTVNINSQLNSSSNNVKTFIENAFNIMEKKYPGQASLRLRNFAITGNTNQITRDSNLRDIASNIDLDELSRQLNIPSEEIINHAIKSGDFDRALGILSKPENYDQFKIDTVYRMKNMQDLFNNNQEIVNQFNSSGNKKSFNSLIYDRIVGKTNVNISGIRQNIVKKYGNNVDRFVYWQGSKRGTTEDFSNLQFANFMIGKNNKKTPLNNSIKIYYPTTDMKTAERSIDEIFKYLTDNKIASDNKIALMAREDGLVLRIYDQKDAINTINYINNNMNIAYVNSSLMSAKKYGKVSVAMDGMGSMNQATSDLLGSYILNSNSNPTTNGFREYLFKARTDVLKGNYSAFSQSANTLSRLPEVDRRANLIQIIDLLDSSINPNASNNDYMNALRRNQSPEYYNSLLRQISNN